MPSGLELVQGSRVSCANWLIDYHLMTLCHQGQKRAITASSVKRAIPVIKVARAVTRLCYNFLPLYAMPYAEVHYWESQQP